MGACGSANNQKTNGNKTVINNSSNQKKEMPKEQQKEQPKEHPKEQPKVDSKPVHKDDPAVNDEIVGGGDATTKIEEGASKVVKDKVCSFNTFSKKSKAKKFDNFNNAFVDSLNFSAKNCKQYFKNQSPYNGADQFVDSIFPPTLNSIFGLDENGISVDPNPERRAEAERDFKIDQDDIVWLTPSQIFGDNYALFEGDIEFDDIRQGSIGNCYFMASLSSITENPEIIAEVFRVHDTQKNGCYEVCLKLDGVWTVIMLDDYIPCSKRTNRPLFANPKGNEIWAILLEKAWAKVNGGYIFTVAGMASEVIECMTNFPYEYNNVHNDEENDNELWNKILQASSNSYIMTTALPPNEEATMVGLVTGHEYTLTFGKEAEVDGNLVKLLKVRNPWGSINYTGDWSQHSNLWTDEAKRIFDYKNTYDGEGEFLISWDDFRKYFADVDICKIENRICMKQSTVPYEPDNLPSCYQIELFDESQITITIFKPYYRFIKDLPTDWTMSQQLFIARLNDRDTLEFSNYAGAADGQNDCTLSLTLQKGEYIFYAYSNWSSARDFNGNPFSEDLLKKLKMTVSVHSNQFFGLNKVEENNMALFHRIAADYSNKNQGQIQNNLVLNSVKNWAGSEFYFVYIKSLIEDKAIELQIDLKNVGLKPITYNQNPIKETAYPNQELVAVFSCQQMFEGHGMGFGYKYKKSTAEKKEILPFMKKLPIYDAHSRNINNYNWIYKKGDVDYKNILKKIDVSDAAFNFFKNQYPKDVEEIQFVPKVDGHDDLKLYVQDKIDFGEGDWYFGEWRDTSDGQKMYGRGKAYLSQQTFIGQFIDHSFTGVGKMILPNGDVLQGRFENFNPVGTCQYTHNDGKVETKNY